MAKSRSTRKRARAQVATADEADQPPAPRRTWTAGLAGALRPSTKWGVVAALRPPPKLSLSEWADRHFYLSAESAAEPGRWKTLPYQRGIMDAISNPDLEWVSVMKSARIGYTKSINAAIGYFIDQDPCPIMVVQPTVEDAEGYSKEEIAPMIRDCAVLTGKVGAAVPRSGKRPSKNARAGKRKESSSKTSAETILHKVFPGGVLSVVGANSGRGFRRTSRRVVVFDEVDGYPASAGNEGDPVKLGARRAEYYWNRKIVAGSTPLIAGSSRIEELFLAGDRRRYFVPCPHCGHMDYLRFNVRRDDDELDVGHIMRWPKDKPELAHFLCRKCGCAIEETSKRAMIEAGEWRAEGETKRHASFHIWAAYSLSPNATWAQLAQEFLDSKGDPLKLKTFVNTTLGETWKDRGEAPDWELLRQRCEDYAIGTVPDGVAALTCGVDVQKDRLMYEVVGWAPNKESWSVEAGPIYGDTSLDSTAPESPWRKLDELLDRPFPSSSGEMTIARMAVDSGYNTQVVYNWCRTKPISRVIACKGVASARVLIGGASAVDVSVRGKRLARGFKMFAVGVNIAKAELYGWLRLKRGSGDAPGGYCHFPQYGDEFFQQITAEHQVTIASRKGGRPRLEWFIQANRENHYLDCRVYARAAAGLLGLDRMRPAAAAAAPVKPSPPSSPPAPNEPRTSADPPAAPRAGFWKQSPAPRRGSWFKPRR